MNDGETQKNSLFDEYAENTAKIDKLTDKIRTINANSFETRGACVLGFTLIPWLILFFLTPTIVKLGIIPLKLIQPLSLGIPLLIGVVGEAKFTKKYQCKERLREFSKARTRQEKIEELTRYEIEKEKLLNANKVLKDAYEKLENREQLISSLSSEYDVNFKNEDLKSANVLELRLENLSDELENKKKKIDVLSTKVILKNRFWSVREKVQGVMENVMAALFGGTGAMMLTSLPLMLINNSEVLIETSLFDVLLPMAIGAGAGGCYYTKKLIDHSEVFKNINRELGDNALDNLTNDSERKRKMFNNTEERFDLELANEIASASEVRFQFETEKQRLAKVLENREEESRKVQVGYEETLESEDTLSKEVEEKGPRLIRKA